MPEGPPEDMTERTGEVTGQFLCEVCFDTLTNHITAAWNGVDAGMCGLPAAPPTEHSCWQELEATWCGTAPRRAWAELPRAPQERNDDPLSVDETSTVPQDE